MFGKTKSNDVAPKIVNGRTMLPARFVAENLGAVVAWNAEKQEVTVKGKNAKDEDITILIYIDSDIAYVNDEQFKLDSPAFIENDRTYTPVRFISEQLGASVEWNEADKTVTITKQFQNAPRADEAVGMRSALSKKINLQGISRPCLFAIVMRKGAEKVALKCLTSEKSRHIIISISEKRGWENEYCRSAGVFAPHTACGCLRNIYRL